MQAGPEPHELDVRDLYERYGRAVYRRCQYFLRSPADAQDAMHDVFLKVVDRHREFRGQSSPLTWLVRITTNHCLNLLRSRKARWPERYQLFVQTDEAGHRAEANPLERKDLVLAILDRVDRGAQEAAVYYFVDEMTQEDAAQAAGCSVPTLRKRLRHFVATARRRIKQMDQDAIFGDMPV